MVRKHPKPDVLNEHCPSRQLLRRVGERWSPLVLYVLREGPHRYGALERRIGGISQKMLTATLRGLERDLLVHRRVEAVVPPCVEYSLTPVGRSLAELLGTLCVWAEKHVVAVETARRAAEG
jgi:DNA-binding HxlR family transcriptional regulator